MRAPPTLDALLVVAVFSRHDSALEWARRRLPEDFDRIALASEPFDFHHTSYYSATMGTPLRKQLLAFHHLVPLDSLPHHKGLAIRMETELRQTGEFPEERPINIDPGLLTLGKFMLATTKDQAHRLYLGSDIFGEVTLRYEDGQWLPWPWTYADYREDTVRTFLNECREYYKQRLRTRTD